MQSSAKATFSCAITHASHARSGGAENRNCDESEATRHARGEVSR